MLLNFRHPAKGAVERTLKIVAFVILGPVLIALMLVPFIGSAPLMVVAIIYMHLLAWPFGVWNDLGGQVDYHKTLERSSVVGCYHVAVSLKSSAQPQPFARQPDELDWQLQRSGPLDSQPTGAEVWLATPLPEGGSKKWLLFDLEECGLSQEVIEAAKVAISEPGSWVANGTRGMKTHLIYSKPQRLALVFAYDP